MKRRGFLGALLGLAVTPTVAARVLRDPFEDHRRLALALEAIVGKLGQSIPAASGGFEVPSGFVQELRAHLDDRHVVRDLAWSASPVDQKP